MTRQDQIHSGRPLGDMAETRVRLSDDALDQLMPMHLLVADDGKIVRTAHTVAKLRRGCAFVGRNLFDVFAVRRPRGAVTIAELCLAEAGRLSLAFRDTPETQFKAVIVPLENRSGALINLSFGFSLVDAVGDYDLTAGDFAGTDLAVEMLYLVEAKSAALLESKKLNMRLQSAKVAAEEQAFTDTLTGLKNRRALDHVLRRLTVERIPFGLLQLDLDYFKQVNDTCGHAAGDEVLQFVARILVQETRSSDTVARVGGDEFTVVLSGLAEVAALEAIANRIIAGLETPIPFRGDELRISGSIGLTASNRVPGVSLEDLLKSADKALYESKRAGRGRVTVAG